MLRCAAILPLLLAGLPARAITCTNPVSGASWTVAVDLAHATVDSYPARVTRDAITWRDPTTNGRYELDRVTGALTAIIPSSTGGYIMHDRCEVASSP